MLAVRPRGTGIGSEPTRREWLKAGAAGLLLPELLARTETAAVTDRPPSFGRARSCIVAFLFGAPAHQDVWDLKPDAPVDLRGEFRPVDTNVPGIRVTEHLPRIGRLAHHLALLRSVSHADNTHTVAMHYLLTGHRHLRPQTNPQNQPDDFPCFGAVINHLRPSSGSIPSGVSLNAPANQVSANNHIFPGFFAGFLGGGYDPLFIAQDPSRPDFDPFPAPADGVRRLLEGSRLLAEVDRQRRTLEQTATVQHFDRYHQRALSLLTSPEARRAFDLTQESDRLRDRYGRSAFGQGCLLARRLVEAGVRLVTVNWARDDAFWDTHANNFKLLKEQLLPPFDRGFAALLEDLSQRGLLAETLVVCLGEFGRTPKINAQAGRDHWAACQTVVLAGGGVRGGQVYGASDRTAAYPATPPVSPDDLAATIYHALGVDGETELRDPLGRPQPLSRGTPLLGLFG